VRRNLEPVSPLLIGDIRITFLGLAQNLAHDAATSTPKSLVLRARVYFPSAHSLTLVESNFVDSQKPVKRIVQCSQSRN
jgi:hypothetical protein